MVQSRQISPLCKSVQDDTRAPDEQYWVSSRLFVSSRLSLIEIHLPRCCFRTANQSSFRAVHIQSGRGSSEPVPEGELFLLRNFASNFTASKREDEQTSLGSDRRKAAAWLPVGTVLES